MKNIAYKTSQNNPNLPNGFITEHFETDEEAVEGYTVVDKNIFSQLLENNVNLFRGHEVNRGIIGIDPSIPEPALRPADHAEPADTKIMEDINKVRQENKADAQMFQQFLEWKRTQSSNS